MKIMVDIRSLMSPIRTGVGEYTVGLLDAIFSLDQTNEYLLFYNNFGDVSRYLPRWNRPNIRYIASRWPNKIFNTSLKLFGRPFFSREPLEYFFSPNLNFLPRAMNTKFVLTVHDLSFEFFPEFYTPKQRAWHAFINPKKLCHRADIILTPSENTKRDIVDYYGISENKIKLIYPGITKIKNQNAKSKNLPTDKYILFLGTIEPRKNILGLIEAFEQIYPKLAVPYSLIIAGAPGWKNKEIYKRIAISPIKEQIKIINFVSPEEKTALYTDASLFVYPSFYEGFGFPVLEAMSQGVPVITSNRSSLPEVAGTSAYYANPNRPVEIGVGIKLLLENRNLRAEQIKNGLEQAAKFTWQRAATEWLTTIVS